MQNVYSFKVVSGEEIVGTIINFDSIKDSGVVLVEWPLILDWNEVGSANNTRGVPMFAFYPFLFGAAEGHTVPIPTKSLINIPVRTKESIKTIYLQRTEEMHNQVEQTARVLNLHRTQLENDTVKGKGTKRTLKGGL
jgi:hypothetical protein